MGLDGWARGGPKNGYLGCLCRWLNVRVVGLEVAGRFGGGVQTQRWDMHVGLHTRSDFDGWQAGRQAGSGSAGMTRASCASIPNSIGG